MKPVKRVILLAALLLGLFFGTGIRSASAHVLESDNGVSAILHLKPDDNPMAGKPIPVNLLFSNDAGGFNLNDYRVRLALLNEGDVKYTAPIEPLFFGAAAEGEVLATFPEPAVYNLQVIGIPTEKDSPPFTLRFTVRVSSSVTQMAKKGDGSTTLILSAFSLVLLAMVAAKVIQSGGKYRRNN